MAIASGTAALIGAGLSSLGGLAAANQQRKTTQGAINAQNALAAQLAQQKLAPYAKKAKNWLYDLMGADYRQLAAGQAAPLISPDLQADQWRMMTRGLEEAYAKGRNSLEQGLVNRGLEYGNVLPDSLRQYDREYWQKLGDIGTQIGTTAATTNYQADAAKRQQLYNTLLQLFTGGKARQQQLQDVGLQGVFSGYGAQAANQNQYYNSLANALGGLAGGLSGFLSGPSTALSSVPASGLGTSWLSDPRLASLWASNVK